MKDQSKVRYVTAIRRILRAAGQIITDDMTVTDLEQRLRDVTQYAPGVTARGLARIYENAARAWERGNNSGNSEVLSEQEQRCDEIRNTADAILLLWNVEVDYPGLYPSFKWNGGNYHDCESLMRWISQDRKAVQSSKPYQPKTGQKCSCRPGQQRDNCPTCEGTGMVVDFAAIRARRQS